MKKSAERQFWTEFLQLYQSLPELWKVDCKSYSNRTAKNRGYEKLVKKLKQIEPEADREMATKKINSFRTIYRREWKKVETSKQLAEHPDDVYVPSLWYFNLLSFLCNKDDDCMDETTANIETDENSSDGSANLQPKRKRICKEEDDPTAVVCDTFEESGNDLSVLAQGWSSQYDEMSKQQKIIARKIIAEVLFHGCLGNLRENTICEIQNMFEGDINKTFNTLYNDE